MVPKIIMDFNLTISFCLADQLELVGPPFAPSALSVGLLMFNGPVRLDLVSRGGSLAEAASCRKGWG